jgi:hypothetical protein
MRRVARLDGSVSAKARLAVFLDVMANRRTAGAAVDRVGIRDALVARGLLRIFAQ